MIPAATTLVVPVAGADVFGKRLDDDHVHRPEIVSALSGAPFSNLIPPEVVARVLAEPEAGRKGVPARARVFDLRSPMLVGSLACGARKLLSTSIAICFGVLASGRDRE